MVSFEDDFGVPAIGDQLGCPFLEAPGTVLANLFREIDRGEMPHVVLPNPDVIYPMRCDRLWTAMRQRSILRLGTRVLRFQQREPKRRLGSDTRLCYGEWSPSSANAAP